ncbi:cytochrome c peroxidase [Actinobacillus delphinicola]|uniref:Cytochrome-c peroxidase n=1 Tax=Actinobacillus delphinicola TaxID=51161 RepID=A0A448TT88_9PAST|nr:cytochrome c peroxidase [Actinobacillus delphinicola]VEJ09136.1 cytochrome-c peroxidase [Actinobacillus delphinicola]
MKKFILGCGILGVIGYLGTVGYVHNFDKAQTEKLLKQQYPGKNQQIANILHESGCQNCHTPNPTLPFYANIPGLNKLVDLDIKRGNQLFNLNTFLEGLKDPSKISEVDLAKLEHVLKDNSMPPLRFKMIHWGSGLTQEENNLLLDWIYEQRQQKFLPQNTQGVDAKRSVQPIPNALSIDAKKAALGNILYHDVRLSGDNTVSCHTCHQLNNGGVDGLVTSTGIKGQKGGINAPTVFNAAFNKTQFWDGRAKDLAAQAGGPPLNPVEMGSKDWNEIIHKLSQDEALKKQFLELYPAITPENITNAIAEFEKTLITPNSAFDKYLKGDKKALSPSAIKGYKLFIENKCSTCHVGVALGGQSYELFGIYDNYFANRKQPQTDADKGRFSQTQNPADLHRFKVPTLRNVALTAPYFHDGSVTDLGEAIKLMAHYQSGTDLTPEQVSDIKAFLESLTGEYQGKVLTTNKQK